VRRMAWLTLAVVLGVALLAGSIGGQAAPTFAALPYKVYVPLAIKSGDTTLPATGFFGYGMSVAMPANSGKVRDAGFGYVKLHLAWKVSEPTEGHYDWADSTPNDSYAGNFVRDAEAAGMKVLLRVDTPPGWANGNAGDQAPPTDASKYGRFLQALATFLKGRVFAYEIWNEPNISSEWGGHSPSPTAYTALLRAAYQGVKAGDPEAKVVSAGLATTGGDGGSHAMDDVQFIRGMYAAGAKPYFDALGSHPYGFSSSPETDPAGGILYFRRVEAQRQVMVDNADSAKQIYATEFGWLLNPSAYGKSCDWPDRNWQKVSPQTQADYLVRAYQYAQQHWSWMGPMFAFNLDFAAVSYYSTCEPMRWYGVLNGDYSSRTAYTALQAMAKPPR
jgi:polysaccharide biosynthesis protein PslG